MDANEFLAATLPPLAARDDQILLDAFRAFDRNVRSTVKLKSIRIFKSWQEIVANLCESWNYMAWVNAENRKRHGWAQK